MTMLVLYHGNCPDGFTAAWSVWQKHPNAEFIGVTHTDSKLPNVDGKDVVLVDFCYKRPMLLKLKDRAKSLLVLDHHQSALEECGDLGFCQFDMHRSGAGMAWDHFNGAETRPWLVNYIEYRDLGKLYNNKVHPKTLPFVREVLYAVDSYKKTFEVYNSLVAKNGELEVGLNSFDTLVTEGRAIERFAESLIQQICDKAYEIEFDGHKVRVANTPVFQSEVANRLAQTRDFGVCWYQLPMKTKWSLRSRDDGGADVCKICQSFPGGGGHVHAGGFSGPKVDVEALLRAAKKDESE